MRVLVYVIILLVGNIEYSMAQIANNTESNDSANIYFQSLRIYCDHLKTVEPETQKIFLEENSLVTKGLPREIEGLSVELVNMAQLKKILKKRKSITLIRVVPLRIKEGRFFINIIPFDVTYIKRNFNFLNGGGSTILYTYHTETQGFILDDVVHTGI